MLAAQPTLVPPLTSARTSTQANPAPAQMRVSTQEIPLPVESSKIILRIQVEHLPRSRRRLWLSISTKRLLRKALIWVSAFGLEAGLMEETRWRHLQLQPGLGPQLPPNQNRPGQLPEPPPRPRRPHLGLHLALPLLQHPRGPSGKVLATPRSLLPLAPNQMGSGSLMRSPAHFHRSRSARARPPQVRQGPRPHQSPSGMHLVRRRPQDRLQVRRLQREAQ